MIEPLIQGVCEAAGMPSRCRSHALLMRKRCVLMAATNPTFGFRLFTASKISSERLSAPMACPWSRFIFLRSAQLSRKSATRSRRLDRTAGYACIDDLKRLDRDYCIRRWSKCVRASNRLTTICSFWPTPPARRRVSCLKHTFLKHADNCGYISRRNITIGTSCSIRQISNFCG